jgi:AcrR family transcriptional regulator
VLKASASVSAPRRTGRPRGSPPNREAILSAARELFIQRGYERTTIRGIAAAARVDPALVHHYFGSKDNLLKAALTVNVTEMVEDVIADGLDGLGERMVRAMFQIYERLYGGLAPLVGLLRSAASNPEAAEFLRQTFQTGGLEEMTRRLRLPQPKLRAALIATELFGLAMVRFVVRLEPVANADVNSLAAWYGPTLQRYLVDDMPDAG